MKSPVLRKSSKYSGMWSSLYQPERCNIQSKNKLWELSHPSRQPIRCWQLFNEWVFKDSGALSLASHVRSITIHLHHPKLEVTPQNQRLVDEGHPTLRNRIRIPKGWKCERRFPKVLKTTKGQPPAPSKQDKPGGVFFEIGKNIIKYPFSILWLQLPLEIPSKCKKWRIVLG